MEEEIITIKNQALAQIMETENLHDLKQIEIDYLGRNGRFSSLIKNISIVPKEDRKQTGIIINEAKQTIINSINSQISNIKKNSKDWFDATVPGIKPQLGHIHLISQAIEEISSVFERIGFVRRRYPEVEWDWYAFNALNFPENHPAWDTLETYFIDVAPNKKFGQMILTPHTSNGQVREMQRLKGQPPIRMINISKTYRRQSDISHTPMFHQFEGLVVDEKIAVTNLKGTLDYFAKTFFGHDRTTRLRPYHFQFTEPSFEVDISCDLCRGAQSAGCRMCKAGWLELGGAGMVHPNVLKAGGVDSKRYTGFAFGWGVERVLMMRSGIQIPDLRLLYSSDLNFLRQYGY